MIQKEYIAACISFRRRTKVIGTLCLTVLLGGVIFSCVAFTRTDSAAIFGYLILGVTLFSAMVFALWKILFGQKTKLTCPHCQKRLTTSLSQQLAIAAGRCSFCGNKLFNDAHPVSASVHFADCRTTADPEISLVPAFPNRVEFFTQSDRQKRLRAKLLYGLNGLRILVLLGMIWLAIHDPQASAFKGYLALAMVCLISLIFERRPLASLKRRKWRRKNSSVCPYCQAPLWGRLPISILLATGSCYYCGKTLWLMEQATPNTQSRHHFHEAIPVLQKRRVYAIRWCLFLFAVLVTTFQRNYPHLKPFSEHHLPITLWGTGLILFMAGCVYSFRYRVSKVRCPHCKNILEEKISSAVAVTTGNCGYCGKPLPWADETKSSDGCAHYLLRPR